MPDTPATTRRWNAFVCPECRQVFRVAGDHDGRGVVCPACHRMLKLPTEGEALPPLVVGARGPLDAAPHHGHGHGPMKRSDEFDETFSKKEPVDPLIVRVVVASAVTLGVLLVAGLVWSGRQNDKAENARETATRSTHEAIRPEIVETPVEPEETAPQVDIAELEPAIRGCFESEGVEGMLPWVLHSDLTGPRIRAEAAGERRPGALREILWNIPFAAAGDRVGVAIRDENFETYCVWLAKEADAWKVDWEATVGWSPVGVAGLRETKPPEPALLRAKYFKSNYYNFGFSDDGMWDCFRLETPDGADYLYGYAAAGSVAARTLGTIPPERNTVTVRVRYPARTESDRQVIIEDVRSESWVISGERP